jgi:hypothetical protein
MVFVMTVFGGIRATKHLLSCPERIIWIQVNFQLTCQSSHKWKR